MRPLLSVELGKEEGRSMSFCNLYTAVCTLVRSGRDKDCTLLHSRHLVHNELPCVTFFEAFQASGQVIEHIHSSVRVRTYLIT